MHDASVNRLPVFVVLDYTGAMWDYIPVIESQLRGTVMQLKKDNLWSSLELYIIGMGGRTGIFEAQPLAESHQRDFLRRHLPSCNLDRALKQVIKALAGRQTSYQVKGEVFIVIGNNPGTPIWSEQLQELHALKVNVSPCAFTFVSRSLNDELLGELSVGSGKPFKAHDAKEATLKQFFLQTMIYRVQASLATKQPKGATREAGAMASGNPSAIPSPRREEGDRDLRARSDVWAPPQGQDVVVPQTIKQANPLPELRNDKVPSPPAANTQGVATMWQNVEPYDPKDPVPHEMIDKYEAAVGWRAIAASRRGKMHAHKGLYREDAFAVANRNGWHLMVVADGCGSCALSRIGSQMAADKALEAMSDTLLVRLDSMSPDKACRLALENGVRTAWEALSTEAQRRGISLGDLGTTLLMTACHFGTSYTLVGTLQIGDGLIAAQQADSGYLLLAEPDVGDTAGTTLFLTSKHWQEWIPRAKVTTLNEPPRLVVAMVDGVADDIIPYDKGLPRLLDTLHQQVLSKVEPERALLEFLGYDRRGSFDDRTMALLYR